MKLSLKRIGHELNSRFSQPAGSARSAVSSLPAGAGRSAVSSLPAGAGRSAPAPKLAGSARSAGSAGTPCITGLSLWPNDVYVQFCMLSGDPECWARGILYIAGPELRDFAWPFSGHDPRRGLPDAQAYLCCRSIKAEDNDVTILPVPLLSRDDLLNHIQEIFMSYENLEHRLMETVIDGGSVQTLVDLITPFFDNELIIMNANFRVIAHSWKEIELLHLSGYEQLGADGTIPMEVANFFRNDLIYRQVEHMKEPFWYEPSVFSRRVLCTNVFIQNEFASRIVLCEINHQLESYDEELLVFFSEFVRRLYRRMERDELQPREDSFTKIMKRLLNRDSVNEAEMAQSLLLHQWSDSSPCSICCMIPDPAAAREKSLAYYCDRLSEIFPDSCAVEHEQKICLLTILQPHYQSQDDLIARISIFQREANFRAGYSDVFTGFQSLPVYYRQAAIALRIGMAENPTIWNHRFKKYRFSYFQERLTSELPAETLIAEELQQLINYDRQNETDYVATLRAFLKHDMNVVQTASALFIHRGTMIYRLKRIQELGNISFEDQEQMLYIRMCLRLFMNAENG